MGFRKVTEDDDTDEEVSVPSKKRKESTGGTDGKKEGFKPTTVEELKQIHKRARKNEEARKEAKSARKEPKIKLPRLAGDKLREALLDRGQFRVYRSNLFEKFIEFCNDNDTSKPRYRAYLPEKEGQAQFMFEISTALSRMSWQQHTALLHAAVTTSDHPVGVSTRSWTEANQFVLWCLYLALGVTERKGTLRLADASVLEEWPVTERQRKSKKDDAMTEDEEKMVAMQAKAKDDDDDEDEDEEDDEAESDDEEDEDDEDEKPEAKKGKGKSSGFGKKSKSDDEDDDADSDEDTDDEDDEKPKKSATKKERAVKKASKAVEKDKKVAKRDKEKAAKAKVRSIKSKDQEPKRAAVDIGDKSIVKKVKERKKGGPKGKLMALIPKKGIAIKDLTRAAKEAGLPGEKVKSWVKFLSGYGFLSVE